MPLHYALFTAYERTAFGELAAAAWIPLLLMLVWRRSDVGTVHLALIKPSTGLLTDPLRLSP